MIAVSAPTMELLRFDPQSTRSMHLFARLERHAPKVGRATKSMTYAGESEWLLLWGAGHPARVEPMRQQSASGGHTLAFDLSYWSRNEKVRLSLDAPHPQRWVMKRDWPSTRLDADRVKVGNDWNPNGHAIIAGLGQKARVQYGADTVDQWEAAMMADCRARGLEPIYRPKSAQLTPPIETALRGASLVMTWHSNVAVDAIRLGIPVICRDGAAAAVCPSSWPADGRPQPLDVSLRRRFLVNLAWFQWNPDKEVPAMLEWVRELLA